jgi:hypothetical protein
MESTLFDTIRQLQWLPRLLADRKRDILQLVLLIRDMFSCFSAYHQPLSHPNPVRHFFHPYQSFAFLFPRDMEFGLGRKGKVRADSHAPIQTLNRDLGAVMVTRQRDLAMFFRHRRPKHHHPHPKDTHNSPPSTSHAPSNQRRAPRHAQLLRLQDGDEELRAHVVVGERRRKLRCDVDSSLRSFRDNLRLSLAPPATPLHT